MLPDNYPRIIALAAVALIATAASSRAQQSDATAPSTRMAWYEKHVAMTKNTPFVDVSWQFIGPKNVSGRVTDVAIVEPFGKTATMYVAGASGGAPVVGRHRAADAAPRSQGVDQPATGSPP